ncbi:histidyl-tRNA synthetase [Candidatus Termititenax persephonae]|uniref:Histidine--tRNA ligase n=1 Tax=Candidatus Termititenax persephonae TaxID=2218525 RepID=A0A388TH40_9BACT|nr:histidyl-tRNA synthetase [Candidatus Termititenax persephonae]
MTYTAPRGTRDILPEETPLWQFVEQKAREVFQLYNFHEIRTPIFEHTELFQRGIGADTDIIAKEMYTFQDRKGRSLTLRPEGTAAVVRAYLESNRHKQEPLSKLWYQGAMFRYERPQAGRYRQFYQIGCEVFGRGGAYQDAEVIATAQQLFAAAGLQNLEVQVNSVGCPVCRPRLKEKIQSFLGANLAQLCGDCRTRFGSNPLRVLDCKNPRCNEFLVGLPDLTDALCADCRTHFQSVHDYLDALQLKFQVNPRLVRGLDYYTKTVFEVLSGQLGAQNAVCGGGRYDNLVEELGGPALPAVGFAFGLERAVMLLQGQGAAVPGTLPYIFLLPLGAQADAQAVLLTAQLRRAGVPTEIDLADRGLAAKLKTASKLQARYVYIIGDNELHEKCGQLKDMRSGGQEKIGLAELAEIVAAKHREKN